MKEARNGKDEGRSFLDLILHLKIRMLKGRVVFLTGLLLALGLAFRPPGRSFSLANLVSSRPVIRKTAEGTPIALSTSMGKLPRERKEQRAGWLSRNSLRCGGFLPVV